MKHVDIQGQRLEYQWVGVQNGRPAIVMLHEGLGSVAMWKDFPQKVAEATRHPVLVYSRHGYGGSDSFGQPRRPDFMHREALEVMPKLLDHLGISAPLLLGHSDGASIALIHAARARRAVAAVCVLAPHVKVEDLTIRSIQAAKTAYEQGDLRAKLSRYHVDVDSAFRGWNDVWLSHDFRAWNIEPLIAGIECPILAIQGEGDAYGTMEQIESIQRHGQHVRLVKLSDCGHSPHRDRPEEVLAEVARMTATLELDASGDAFDLPKTRRISGR